MASIILSLPPITTTALRLTPKPSFHFQGHQSKFKFKFKSRTASSPSVTSAPVEPFQEFDWFSQWYPIAPVCDIDKRVPSAKRVLGIDLVVWWDRNESKWKAFDDRCPHRLAPLSEGRIDQWGRLQCVYHGWCFNGSGDCNLIPQSPPDAPPFHTFKKACVAAYPCTVQNGIVWFWPNSDLDYKDILTKNSPPYVPELDDPSFTHTMSTRDFPYGHEVLIENLSDPAHLLYAHHQLMRVPKDKNRSKVDREGGRPIEISVKSMNINGYLTHGDKKEMFISNFVAPCLVLIPYTAEFEMDGSWTFATNEQALKSSKKVLLVFFCIPVSPGNSRLIWCFPRNVALWVDKIVPRWIFHLEQNLILDSDLYLLHIQERKLQEVGPSNWKKAYFVPTKADTLVVTFRKWLDKYSNGQVNYGDKFDGTLPPPPPRKQVMDRYWSHVKNCTSCTSAYKGLNVLQVMLQVLSFGLVGFIAVTKRTTILNMTVRTSLVSLAVICFAASKWMSRFIYKNFHYHDYDHGLV